MSISDGLSSALSGLTAAAKAAEIVSSNIANATTEGYGRREVLTSARTIGQTGHGVKIVGVQRHTDPVLLAERRSAEAGLAERRTQTSFFQKVEAAIGTADTALSIDRRIREFDSALIEAASLPDSDARLARVAQTAQSLAAQIASAAKTIQNAREEADNQIESDVNALNRSLRQIAELNGQIRAGFANARDASALMDQRQQLIDAISSIVPLREVARENGQISLYTVGGAVLLDGQAATFGFDPSGIVTAGMSLGAGSLSGLLLNYRPIDTSGADSLIQGGSLAAHFEVRDSLGPNAQSQLDALARDLVERFSQTAVDPTIPPGGVGLFTDSGGGFTPTQEVGLAQRLGINPAIDPLQGGAIWRLRDGLGAPAPGPIGSSERLVAMQRALTTDRTPASGQFTTGARSFGALQADVLSSIASARLTSEAETSYAAARTGALTEMEKAQGVDTDQEMQSLLLIEQAYSANAKVIQTIGQMIDTLLGM
jgi:flagellar hook-associated protein 1 FlgK